MLKRMTDEQIDKAIDEIDPDEFYTAEELASGFRIAAERVEKARQAGQLKDCCCDQFYGHNVIDWLRGGASISYVAPAPAPEPNTQTGDEPMKANIENAEQRFNDRVNELAASGMKRSEAVRMIATGEPELHRAFLVAVNKKAGRVYAVKQLQQR